MSSSSFLSTSPAELTAVAEALLLLEAALPELPGLTPHDRKRRLKMGDKSEAFVVRTLLAARQHGHLIPRGYNLDAVEAQAALRPLLRALKMRLQVLCERLTDAHMIAGGSLLGECMALYKTMKLHSKGEGIEDLLGEMQRRFARPAKSHKTRGQESSPQSDDATAARTQTSPTRTATAASVSVGAPSISDPAGQEGQTQDCGTEHRPSRPLSAPSGGQQPPLLRAKPQYGRVNFRNTGFPHGSAMLPPPPK